MKRVLDEEHWYGAGWASLRHQVTRLGVAEGESFLRTLTDERQLGDAAPGYIAKMLTAVKARITPGAPSMWDFALSLFGNPEDFALRAARDVIALRGEKTDENGDPIDPKRALGRLLIQYFNDAVARLRPTSPGEQRVWRQIRAISEEIAKSGPPLAEGDRCAERHLRSVLEVIRTRHPNDHNLPRRFEKLEWYFGRFCNDCKPFAASEGSWLQQDTDLRPSILHCLQALLEEDRVLAEAVAASYGLAVGQVTYLSAKAYRDANGISVPELDRRVSLALPILRTCIEGNVEASLALEREPQAIFLGGAGFADLGREE